MQINQGLSEELFRLFSNLGQAAHQTSAKALASPIQFTLMVTLADLSRLLSQLNSSLEARRGLGLQGD